MKKNTSRVGGFTLVEIMIVVAIIGLLAAVAIPNFVKARNKAQETGCISNLRNFEGALSTWALENRKSDQESYTMENLKAYIKTDSTGDLPHCPGGGTYNPGASVANPPTCTVTTHKLP